MQTGRIYSKGNLAVVTTTKSKREHVEYEAEKLKKEDKVSMEDIADKNSRVVDDIQRQMPSPKR